MNARRKCTNNIDEKIKYLESSYLFFLDNNNKK